MSGPEFNAQQMELTESLRQALVTQQPFFTALMNQITSLESRQSKQAADMMAVRDTVNLLVNQELRSRLDTLDTRLKSLEDVHQQRRGIMSAAEWMPRLVQWLTVLIVIVFFMTQSKVKLP